MKTVAITGPTEMLGSMVYNVLKDKFRLILICDDNEDLTLLEKTYGDTSKHKRVKVKFDDLYQDYLTGFPDKPVGINFQKMIAEIGPVDAFINCASVVKSNIAKDPIRALGSLTASSFKPKRKTEGIIK